MQVIKYYLYINLGRGNYLQDSPQQKLYVMSSTLAQLILDTLDNRNDSVDIWSSLIKSKLC